MDGLEEFEKSLAVEQAARARVHERKHERKHSEHRHHDNTTTSNHRLGPHKSRRRHEDHDEADKHDHKRLRHNADDSDGRREHRRHGRHGHREHRRKRSHEKTEDLTQDLPIPDKEVASASQPAAPKLVRDDWMTNPSALGVDYTQRGSKLEDTPSQQHEPQRSIHSREINSAHLQQLNDGKAVDETGPSAQHDVDYTFGDSGSQWRMTKLKAVYTTAKQSGRSVNEAALDRYGDLRGFDDAREEQIEMERRKTYGAGYVGKEKPSGELFQDRKLAMGIDHDNERQPLPELDQGTALPDEKLPNQPTPMLDQTSLNKMLAQLMKAKLRKAPDVAKLEADYNKASAALAKKGPDSVVLNPMENRMLAGTRNGAKAIDTKRGRERGLVEENDEMSIQDMVREERRTRGQVGGDGLRLAERIAKDGKFDNDLDYMEENAEKLAKRVQRSEINLKNAAIGDFQKINRILDNCQLCHHEDRNQAPVAPIVSLATRVFLTLPTEPELGEGGAVIVPIQHRRNLIECDDDEWEEIRNFMKCLTRMYHDQGRDVIFYENAAAPQRHMHAAMQAVPIPYELGDTAPAFFKEAFLSADEEWSQHKKIIDTGAKARGGMGRMAFRRSIAKEMPYFHAWFTLDGGLGHVVEDSNRWPKGDLFAREVIGGMLDAGPDIIKKQGRWHKGDTRVEAFSKRWRKFDWTRVLADS